MVEVIYPAFKYVMLNMVKFIKTSTLIKYYQTFKKWEHPAGTLTQQKHLFQILLLTQR